MIIKNKLIESNKIDIIEVVIQATISGSNLIELGNIEQRTKHSDSTIESINKLIRFDPNLNDDEKKLTKSFF